MKFSRRQFLHQTTAATAALVTIPGVASAQAYPLRPVRIVVGFPAGGSVDIVARLIGQWLSERLGQQFLIENRPGAASNIATEAVVNAPADGYTLLLASTSNAILATLYDKLNFNFIRDIAPVSGIVRTPGVMETNLAFAAKSVPGFIAYAKASPSLLNMASAGIGNPSHMFGELFKMMSGVNMLHVPYRGEAPALTDLIGGQVQVYFGGLAGSIEHLRTGSLRALAVTTASRSTALPDVPSMSEFLPGYEASAWYGIAAARNTSPEIIERLNKEINAGLADPRLQARFADLGGAVVPGSPVEFGELIVQETEKWAKVVKFSGAKAG
jgi:tripartite-type tricarboxylate transporter receptor subunit TctC